MSTHGPAQTASAAVSAATPSATVLSSGPSAQRRRQLGRRAQLLAGASVTYNLIECVVAVLAGAAASSVALIGFGLDSLVEVGSGVVILWQFRHPLPETREKQALRYIGLSFFALAAYVTFESVRSLLGAQAATPSGLGIGIAVASLAIMPTLSWAQRRTGRELGSGSVVADSKQTLLCTYLSAVLLLGLLVNAFFGWSWADAVAGLVIAAVAIREGVEAWRGEGCGCVPNGPASLGVELGAGCADGCGPGCQDACCASASAAAPSAGIKRETGGVDLTGSRPSLGLQPRFDPPPGDVTGVTARTRAASSGGK